MGPYAVVNVVVVVAVVAAASRGGGVAFVRLDLVGRQIHHLRHATLQR